jgi:ABC-type branched-subunit amino acid transport system ATPase component/ABC-type branched-subunit amino acid transport system permease subunit
MTSVRARRAAAFGLAAVLVVLIAKALGFKTPAAFVTLGCITGITYGLLSVGLVLVFRSSRVINFAHGEVGAFAAAFFGLLAVKYDVPYYVVLPLALAVGAAAGAGAEIAVVRRLRNAPRLMSIVATLGVGQFLVLLGALINDQAGAGSSFPQPPGLPSFTIGILPVTPAYSGMLIFGPVVVVALAAFLKYTRFGLAIRAAAANPDAARMAMVPAARMSALTWALAGALSALTAILTLPTQGYTTAASFGPSLLLRALAGAVLARMNSLPIALLGGIGLGVLEQLLLVNYPSSGVVEVTLFAVIGITLLLQRQRGGRDEEKGSWAAVQVLRPVPAALKQLWLVRNLGLLFGSGVLVVAALLPLVISNSKSIILVGIMGFSIVGLSVGIVTGLGGQLSLGQFAVGGIGAWASWEVSHRIGHYEVALLYAGIAGAVVSLVIGLPALRIRGLFLTVTTLSFALAMPAFFLQQDFLFGDGVFPGRPIVGQTRLDSGHSYYLFVLVVLVLALVLARNVRRGGFGLLLTAVRDNEDAAKAFTIRSSLVKTQGFLLGGFLAGVGGAVYGHSLSQLNATVFPTKASIDIVVMTVIGGISLLAGPIIGALFVIGIPAFLPLDSAGLAASALGQLIIVLYLPGGLGGVIEPVRDRLVKWLGRRAGIDVEAAYAEVPTAAGSVATGRSRSRTSPVPPSDRLLVPGEALLEVRHLAKSFGGVHAVRGVSFDVRAGETVGLIGPNGAGKTTTFELVGGFVKPDSGVVRFDGEDVSALGPEARGKLGLIRSFQDAALFPTLTVEETVRLSLERLQPTPFLSSVLGIPGGRAEKDRLVDDLLGFMGLQSYRTSQIQQLSTGTRRITEIACLVALQPTLLLLDEPSSGVAQRETEALGQLLIDLKEQLQLSLLIIEHDIPFVLRLSDRVVAMADGEVIAVGTPLEVRNDPAVVEAYLGGSIEAIERSDSARPVVPQQASGPDLVIPGVGAARAARLLDAFGSVEALRRASVDEIAALDGFGPGTARRVLEALK